MGLQSYRDLDVWQRAMDLVEAVYTLARSFPDDGRFGATSQIRRAVVSIPANIAEGCGRSHRATTSGSCRSPAARFVKLKPCWSSPAV